MDSGKVSLFLAAGTVTLLCVIGLSSGKPAGDQQWSSNPILDPNLHYELHPIDNCIFACDRCFKAEALVKCANACIISDAQMDSEWATICPSLARQYLHPQINNPFRH